MKLERLNLPEIQPVMGEERLLQIAQYIDIGFAITLWLTYLLAIMASFQHVAWAFALLEEENQKWVGYLAAAAVDGALAVMAYTIQQRRRGRRVNRELGEPEAHDDGTNALWLGLIFLGGISVIANFLHGIHVELNTNTLTLLHLRQLDGLQWVRLTTNAIALPLIVVYLGEVVSVPGAGGVITNLLRRQQALRQQVAELAQTRTDLHEAETALHTAETELHKTQTELHKTQTELHQAVDEAGTTAQALHMAEEALHRTQTELHTVETELHEAQAALHAAETKLSQTEVEYNTAAQALHRREAELGQKNTELAQQQQVLAAVNIPVQETMQYLANLATGVSDTQELAAGRASERLGTLISRDVIGRIARVIRLDESE